MQPHYHWLAKLQAALTTPVASPHLHKQVLAVAKILDGKENALIQELINEAKEDAKHQQHMAEVVQHHSTLDPHIASITINTNSSSIATLCKASTLRIKSTNKQPAKFSVKYETSITR
eukprot:12317488-Ditylum_brightwellii.AAC.1